MKKAIKTSLLAAAVAASFGASATLTVTGTAQNVGVEGTATGTFVNIPTVTATASGTATEVAAYGSLGGMKVTLSGGTFNAGTSFVSNNSLVVDGVPLAFGTDYSVSYNSEATEATITFLNTTAVGNAQTAMSTGGGAIVIAANVIKVNGTAIAAKSKTEITIAPFSNVGGQTIETGKVTVLNGVTQLGSKVTKFAEKIDVSQDKMYWAGGSKDASTTTTVELNSAAVDVNAVGSTGDATVTLKGDFTFLDADNDGKLDAGTSISATGTTTVAKDLKSVSTKVSPGFGKAGGNASAASTTVTFTITTDGKREIPVQDFTVDAAYNYTGTGTVSGSFAVENASAGSWTLNGSSPRIPYMPFGAGISQIVYVTNNGKVDGAVSFTAYDEAGTKYTGTLDVVAKANAVTQLSQALRQGLDAAGFSGTGKLKIDLTINSPSGDLQVFAAYNVRGDRLAVGIF